MKNQGVAMLIDTLAEAPLQQSLRSLHFNAENNNLINNIRTFNLPSQLLSLYLNFGENMVTIPFARAMAVALQQLHTL